MLPDIKPQFDLRVVSVSDVSTPFMPTDRKFIPRKRNAEDKRHHNLDVHDTHLRTSHSNTKEFTFSQQHMGCSPKHITYCDTKQDSAA